jgi:hypothetical protein
MIRSAVSHHLVAPTPGPVSGPIAQQAAKAQLRKPEYHRHDPNVVTRVIDWILDRLSQVGSAAGNPAGAALLFVVVVLLALVIFLLWRAGPLGGPRRAAHREDPLRSARRTDHRALARRYTDDGEWALAVREWLRCAVQTIEDRGVLDPRPGRTGTEVAREAGERLPSARDSLIAATQAFEQIWFGRRPATPQDVEVARLAADSVPASRITVPTR